MIYTSHSGETVKYVGYIIKFVYNQGHIPLNPFVILGDYYMHTCILADGDKHKCTSDNISQLAHCDELWVFGKDKEDFHKKDGVRAEIEAWKKIKDPSKIKYFTWEQIGVPKYVKGSKWGKVDEK